MSEATKKLFLQLKDDYVVLVVGGETVTKRMDGYVIDFRAIKLDEYGSKGIIANIYVDFVVGKLGVPLRLRLFRHVDIYNTDIVSDFQYKIREYTDALDNDYAFRFCEILKAIQNIKDGPSMKAMLGYLTELSETVWPEEGKGNA